MAARIPAEVFAPGAFLQEELEERGWSQADLAEILNRPPRVVSEIITGKRGISVDTARGLAAAIGTTPEYWLNLDAYYQLYRSNRPNGDDEAAVTRRARLYSLAPVKELLRRGWIERSDNVEVLERRILDFLEISSIDEEPMFRAHAARKSTSYSIASFAQRAWLFRARMLARAVHAGRFSRASLEAAVQRLRPLLHVPQEARHVPGILSDAGVRLVIVEALTETRIDGACFWVEDGPVIALSMRFDRIDYFWFTLMHEIGHLVAEDVAVDTNLQEPGDGAERLESESVADEFANEFLVPRKQLESFIARIRPLYSAGRIEAFAQTTRVHPGLVVGQLQHRGEVAGTSFRRQLVPIRALITDAALTDGWDSRVLLRA